MGSTQILSLPLSFPSLLCCVSAGVTVVGADRTHPDAPLPLWLGGRNRWPRRLGGALAASPALLRSCETMLGEPLCLLSEPPFPALSDSLRFLLQLSIVGSPGVTPRTLFGSFEKSIICKVRCHASATRISRPPALRGLGAGPFHPPCPAGACSDGASRTPSPVISLGPSKEGYRRVGGIAQYRPIPLPMGHPHASAPAAHAHCVRDAHVCTGLASVCTTGRVVAPTPLPAPPQGRSQPRI